MTTATEGRRRVDLDALAELEEQRAFLLRSLDDLERERAAGDIDDADYRTLRDDYTARAAAVIRAIDEGRASLPGRRSLDTRRTLLAAAGVLVVAVIAGLGVAAASGTRLNGEFGSGETRDTSVALLREAAQLARDGQVMDALERYDEVLEADPLNAPALTYKGWLLVDVGDSSGERRLVERGTGILREAVEADPTYPDARFFYGFVLLRLLGDRDAALEQFRAAIENDPPASLRTQAEMVVRDLERGGDGIPDNVLPADPGATPPDGPSTTEAGPTG